MRFQTTCVSAYGPDIEKMTDAALQITRRTFLEHINRDDLAELEKSLGYESHHTRGLTMAADYYVSYYRSKYCGRRCYYICWSAIEHIFHH